MELFDSVYQSEIHTMKFHSLDHSVEEVRKFGDISVLTTTAYERLNVHIKRHTESRLRGVKLVYKRNDVDGTATD